MANNEIASKALKGLVSEEEFATLTPKQQMKYNIDSSMWELDRQRGKRKKADLGDVQDSITELSKAMTEMPDMAKVPFFAEVLIKNGITKWQLLVATAEILRSKTKFTAVCEYFLAIDRIKIRMRASSLDIWHDKALDF